MASCQTISSHDEAVLNRVFNPNLPYDDIKDGEHTQENVLREEETPEVLKAKKFEVEGVQKAEAGDVFGALDCFNAAIQVAPWRASGYNNRAQALRLKADVKGAIEDLDKAIELSGGKGTGAQQAYAQRGIIRRLEGDEDGAREDFKQAAELGCEFSRNMVIQLNPYAAMCNQMLSEVIGRVQSGHAEI